MVTFSSGLLPAFLPLLACLFQLAIPCRVNLRLASGQPVRRRDESNSAVQPHGVIGLDLLLNKFPPVLSRQRRSGPDTFTLERFVPALDFTVGLRIVG